MVSTAQWTIGSKRLQIAMEDARAADNESVLSLRTAICTRRQATLSHSESEVDLIRLLVFSYQSLQVINASSIPTNNPILEATGTAVTSAGDHILCRVRDHETASTYPASQLWSNL